MEQVREENAELRRRTLEAERTIGELLRDREGGGGGRSTKDDALKTGSAIFDEGRDVRVEGLPKTIPARAARAAGLITSALSSSASLRGTVGRTLVSPSGSGVAPTARPGNVWATLMNGGAAGKVEYT
uniref:Uncharacterized protein n=2 Tax=Cryptomonas curvata TaxID=233186 RepID=A0A7S0MBE7_9CRYP|mmetsp:Transcript_30604/g.64028  ORF Transcript_30604/g.64028 Transcript_30604/m.64028 type:complete len:128 (+) Transcript_30604:506-889(+)